MKFGRSRRPASGPEPYRGQVTIEALIDQGGAIRWHLTAAVLPYTYMGPGIGFYDSAKPVLAERFDGPTEDAVTAAYVEWRDALRLLGEAGIGVTRPVDVE